MDRIVYDAWGNILAPSNQNPSYLGHYGWDSYFIDVAPKNDYLVAARVYDPEREAWLEQDPLGPGGGDPNYYRYAGNSPVSKKDPSGLTTFGLSTLVGTAAGAAVGFVGAGLTGEGDWDMDRAWAGAASGAMVGAGIGLMVDTWGTSSALSAGLIGAGIGAGISSAAQGGLFSNGPVDWKGWGRGAVQGGVSGFVGGAATAGLGPMVGCGRLANLAFGFGVGAGSDALGQGAAMALGLQDKFDLGQMLMAGGMGAALQYLSRACFTAEMMIETTRGLVRWDSLLMDDKLAACDEHDPHGPIEYKDIVALFQTRAVIWHVHVNGKVIRTTGEHPIYVWQKGWISAKHLQPGDLLRSGNGRLASVEEVYDTGIEEKVYNCAVADYHTYFVGGEDWGFSVWAHNSKCWQVGEFEQLENFKDEWGVTWVRHHVPQTVAGVDSVGGFTRELGPAIMIPEWMHLQIQHLTLNGFLTENAGSITTHVAKHVAQLEQMGVPQKALDVLQRAISWWK